MMIKNKILCLLAVSLFLSACNDNTSTSKESDAAIAETTIAQEPTLDASSAQAWIDGDNQLKTDVMADSATGKVEVLKEQEMSDLKNKLSGWQQGRVQYINIEGGFYGIITDSGEKILPMNMAKEFAKDGAIVRIKGKIKKVATIQQWGTPFTITDIELIEPGNTTHSADM